MISARRSFAKCGKNVVFFPINSIFSYKKMFLGNDIYIGPNANFSADSNATITLGNKILFGPGVKILCGNHNTSIMGKYMFDIEEKRPEDDQPVIFEDDIWVGADAIILKGVTIGRGSIIAAGAIVTKNVPRYSVVAGIPAKVIKYRWNPEEIKKHEEIIGTN